MASGREPMKVVIINTKYVETDATSFKSVVQELTGKDSNAAVSGSTKPRSRFYKEEMIKKRKEEQVIEEPAGFGTSSGGGSSILMKNLSFKEFDRLLKEMPPVDDLLWNMD